MNAVILGNPGLENLKVIDNLEKPRIDDHGVLIVLSPRFLRKLQI